MQKLQTFNKVFQKIAKLLTVNELLHPPSDTLKNEMTRISNKWKRNILIMVLIILLSYLFFLNRFLLTNRQNILIMWLKIFSFNNFYVLIVFTIILMVIMIPHSIFFLGTPIFYCLYCNTHVKFLLKRLMESMKRLQEIEEKFDNVSDCINSNLYQELIRKEMRQYLMFYIRVKK